MSKHTPGPWKAFSAPSITAVMVDGLRRKGREVVHWTGFDASDFPDDVEANARLIAAAPELLEALTSLHKEIRSRFGRESDMSDQLLIVMIKARAAIQKAGGE